MKRDNARCMERTGDGRGKAEWGAARTRTAAILLAAVLMAEQMALGANGPILAIAAAATQIGAAIVILILLAPPAAFWRPAAPALLFAGAAIGWIALHALPGRAIAPDLVPPGLVRAIGLLATLLAAGWVGYRRGLMRIAIGWIVLFGLVQIAAGLVLRAIDPAHVWGIDKGILIDRFTGTSLNANASAALFGVIALLGLGRWLMLMRESGDERDSGVIARVAALLGLLMGMGACIITGSRTAPALLVLALGLVAAGDPMLRRWLLRPRGIATMIATGVVAVMLALTIGDMTLERLALTGNDAVTRIDIWRHYARLAGDAWLWGYGPLSFDEVSLIGLKTAGEASLVWYIHSPHNEILSLLLDGGLPYLVLALATIAAMLATIHTQRDMLRADPLLRAVLIAAGFVAACSTVDITLDVPAMAALEVALLGLPWGRAVRRMVDQRQPRALPPPGQSPRYPGEL